MLHKARWEFSANDYDPLAILFVDWFNTGSEDEASYVFRARDVTKGSYEVIFEGNDETFRRQYYQLPNATDMIATIVDWQNAGG